MSNVKTKVSCFIISLPFVNRHMNPMSVISFMSNIFLPLFYILPVNYIIGQPQLWPSSAHFKLRNCSSPIRGDMGKTLGIYTGYKAGGGGGGGYWGSMVYLFTSVLLRLLATT